MYLVNEKLKHEFKVEYYRDGVYKGIFDLFVEEEFISQNISWAHTGPSVQPGSVNRIYTLIESSSTNIMKKSVDEIFPIDGNFPINYKHELRFKNKFINVVLQRAFVSRMETCDDCIKYELCFDYDNFYLDFDLYEKNKIRLDRKRKIERIRESNR